jgi:iron complex outermembrane recepter protein
MRGLLSSLSVIALAAATATAATAQESSPAQSQSGGRTPAQSAEVIGLEEVVVTASRREETVQRAALSVQALSAATLERANVTKPEDLNAIAPGLAIASAGNSPQAYIRGVGNFASNGLAEGAVAFNLDGVYISRPPSVRGMFYDLERIEVLKGPQGTLYGRNASGGAINVISRRPKLGETSGYMELQAGNYDLARGTAAVNVPLGDTVAIRAATQIMRRDGYLSDGTSDEKGDSARLQLLWEPTDAVSLLVSSNYQRAFGKGSGVILSPQLAGDKYRAASDPAVSRIIQAQPGIGGLLVFPKDDPYRNSGPGSILLASRSYSPTKWGRPALRRGSATALKSSSGLLAPTISTNSRTSQKTKTS